MTAKTINRSLPFFGVSWRIIGIIFIARLIANTCIRILYPFIPQLSEGLGLSLTQFSWMLAIGGGAGIISPLLGLWADRYGRRKLMIAGLACQMLGSFGLLFARQWAAILPALGLGVGLTAFLPAQQGYISDQTPYRKQGRAMAAVEFSWAATAIFILPLMGWLMSRFAWWTPFLLLSLLNLMNLLFIYFRLPPTDAPTSIEHLSWAKVRPLLFQPKVLACFGVSFPVFAGVTAFMTLWSIWLSAEFQMGATGLGLVATGTGLAELAGAILSSLFIDRIGKRRGSGLVLLSLIIVFGLMPFTPPLLVIIIPLLLLIGILYEFGIVSLFPLYAEQLPQARSTVMALVFLGGSLGGGVAPPLTTILWNYGGLAAVAPFPLICVGVALVIMWRFLPEAPEED